MPTDPPLIREGSRVFAALGVAALLVGGVAGMVNRAETPAGAPSELASSAEAAAAGHGADHAEHGEHEEHVEHGEGMEHPVGHPPDADPAAGTAVLAGTHEHAAADPADPADDHGAHDADGQQHDAAGHAAGDDHHAATGCADEHPRTVSLVAEVQNELTTTFKDVATLVALGYHPYFDSFVPGGYPPGGEGISHWINPSYIDDGVVLDPSRPETILLDDWNWPIGMMFINDPGVPPVPVYVNDDGTACSPWHPHTDEPARIAWYYYRAVYDRELEGQVPAQTPEMMHVWALPNPAGVYAAHDYPPSEHRRGAPGPLPSYLADATLPESPDG